MKNVIKQSWNRLARSCRSLLSASALVLGGALLVSPLAQAGFVNGSFEDTPALTGWTVESYLNNKGGISTFPPTQLSHLNLTAPGASNGLSGVFAGTDGNTGNALVVPRPGFGTQAARVNGPTDSWLTSSITQTATMVLGDKAPDGNIHVRFALAPVLENPNHPDKEQPYFFVQLTNVTKGTTLFTQFNFANEPGVSWSSYNDIQFTDWVTYDLPFLPGQVDVGDQVKMMVLAADCSQGGHWGYVYADQAGTAPLPILTVSATGPAAIGFPATSTITYTYSYMNSTGVATDDTTVIAVLPKTFDNKDTTFNSYNAGPTICTTPAVGVTGTVSCNFGTLAPGQTGTFTITVNVPADASTISPNNVVTHGSYTIQATGLAPVTGAKVVTTLNAQVAAVNPVPTLSQWGMILMAALLAVMALLQLPLKNRRS